MSEAAFGIYPRQRATPSSAETREVAARDIPQTLYELLVPQDAVDVGLMALPFGGALRKLGAAVALGGAASDAEAGVPGKVRSALMALREEFAARQAILEAQRRAADAPARPMLQGVYRGYAGDNSAMAADAPLFIANQRPMAEAFAARRAAQTGEEPHLEMFLINPNVGRQYRIHPPEAREPSLVRKVDPRELSGRTQLYRRGGLAQMKECSCHG